MKMITFLIKFKINKPTRGGVIIPGSAPIVLVLVFKTHL